MKSSYPTGSGTYARKIRISFSLLLPISPFLPTENRFAEKGDPMKVAFPTQQNFGLNSPLFNHFGSAVFFIVADTETNQFESVTNPDRDHVHGQCSPLNALNGTPVDAIVVGGIGKGALQKLQAADIKVFRGIEGNVSENLERIKAGKLIDFSMDLTCSGHGIHGECSH
jgi:predicted Fe-Mo cluster-binding NifX family protein